MINNKHKHLEILLALLFSYCEKNAINIFRFVDTNLSTNSSKI